MMSKRNLRKNTLALSVMYDAVFFVVMVSLCGAILLPAMMNQTAIQSSVEKHREELVDETLLMLMTSREPEFNYTFAGSLIPEEILEIDLINTTIQSLLGKQLQHKTYADLFAENLVSQLNVFHNQINLFTDQYNINLKQCVTSIIENHTGNKYAFNLSLIWHPIKGLPFGGELFIGDMPPQKNIHVAKAYITLPETKLSDWLQTAENFIIDSIENDPVLKELQSYLVTWSEMDKQIIRENITRIINTTIQGVLFDGVSLTIDGTTYEFSGVVNNSIDFIFDKIQKSINTIIDKALGKINGLLSELPVPLDFNKVLNENLTTAVTMVLQSFIPDFTVSEADGDGFITLDDVFISMKNALVTWAKNYMMDILWPFILSFVDIVMNHIDPLITTVHDVSTEILGFFSQRMNILRAEIQLSIWEARG